MARVAYDIARLKEGLAHSDRLTVGRALTLVESQLPAHRLLAQQLLRELPPPQASHRIGVTGPPGAGKSSLIEALGLAWVARGQKVGVVAIDPSSQTTGGSILGDKTRMERLSQCDQAFLRPCPAGGALGGVARRTRECLTILEAAGYCQIVVETVGVGQSEIAVAQLVDTVLLVALPGAGDEVQGIKRGLMENADVVFVNKAEDQPALAQASASQMSLALRLLTARTPLWKPPVLTGSAHTGAGLEALMVALEQHQAYLGPELPRLRGKQNIHWFRSEVEERLLNEFFARPHVQSALPGLEEAVREGRLTADEAAVRLLSP